MVSVVICCKNSSKYVKYTLQSVAAQSYRNFEIILIDDGSTDNTVAILEEFINSHKEISIKLVKLSKNVGVAQARNIGVKESSGEFLLMLDSDDLIDCKFLEKMMPPLERGEVDIMACNPKFFGSQEGIWNMYALGFTIDEFRQGNILCNCSPYRREIFDKIGGYKNVTHEDYYLFAQACLLGYKLGRLNEILFHYRRYPQQRTALVDNTKAVKEVNAMIDEHLGLWTW